MMAHGIPAINNDPIVKTVDGEYLSPPKVKPTVLPTDSTSRQSEDKRKCELVIRSATTSYYALGMFDAVKDDARAIKEIFEEACSSIQNRDNDFEMKDKTPNFSAAIDTFQKKYYTRPPADGSDMESARQVTASRRADV